MDNETLIDPLLVVGLIILGMGLILSFTVVLTYIFYQLFFNPKTVDMGPTNRLLFLEASTLFGLIFAKLLSDLAGAIVKAGGNLFVAAPRLLLLFFIFSFSWIAVYNAGPIVKTYYTIRQCGGRQIVNLTLDPLLQIANLLYNLGIGIWNFIREATRIIYSETRAIALDCGLQSDPTLFFELVGDLLFQFATAWTNYLIDDPLGVGTVDLIPVFETIGDILEYLRVLLTCACPIFEFFWALVAQVIQLNTLHIGLNAVVNSVIRLIQIIPNAFVNMFVNFTPLVDELVVAILALGDALEDAVFLLLEFLVGLVAEIVGLFGALELAKQRRKDGVETATTASAIARASLFIKAQTLNSIPVGLSEQESVYLAQIMNPPTVTPSAYAKPMHHADAAQASIKAVDHATSIANVEAALFNGIIPDELASLLAPTPGFVRIVTNVAAAALFLAEIILNIFGSIHLVFLSDGLQYWNFVKIFDSLETAWWAATNLFLLFGPDIPTFLRFFGWTLIAIIRIVFEFVPGVFYAIPDLPGNNPLEYLAPFYGFYDVEQPPANPPVLIPGISLGIQLVREYPVFAIDAFERFVNLINPPSALIAGGFIRVLEGGIQVAVQIVFFSWSIIKFGPPPNATDIEVSRIFTAAAQVIIGLRNLFWQFDGDGWEENCDEVPGNPKKQSFFCCLGDVGFNIGRLLNSAISEIVYFVQNLLGAFAGEVFDAEDAPSFGVIIESLERTICALGCTIAFIIPFPIPCNSTARECQDGRACVGGILCAFGRFGTGILSIINNIYVGLINGQSPFTDFTGFFIPNATIFLQRGADIIYSIFHVLDCLICLIATDTCNDAPLFTFISGFLDPLISLIVDVGAILISFVNLIVTFFTGLFGGDPFGAIWALITGVFELFIIDLGELFITFLRQIPIIGDIIKFFEGLKRETAPLTSTVQFLVDEAGLDTTTMPSRCRAIVETNLQNPLTVLDRETRNHAIFCVSVYSWEQNRPAAQARAAYSFSRPGAPAEPPLAYGDSRLRAQHLDIPNACDDTLQAYAEARTDFSSLRPLEVAQMLECNRVWRTSKELRDIADADWVPVDLLYNPTRLLVYPIEVASEGDIWYQYHSDQTHAAEMVASSAYAADWASRGLWTGHYDEIDGDVSRVDHVIGNLTLFDYLLHNGAHHPEAVSAVADAANAVSSAFYRMVGRFGKFGSQEDNMIKDMRFSMSPAERRRSQGQAVVNILWHTKHIYEVISGVATSETTKRNGERAWSAIRSAGLKALDQSKAMIFDYVADWSAYNQATARISAARAAGSRPRLEDVMIHDDAISRDRIFTAGNSEGNAVSAEALSERFYNAMPVPMQKENVEAHARERALYASFLPRSMNPAKREAAVQKFAAYQTASMEEVDPEQSISAKIGFARDVFRYLTRGNPLANIRRAKVSFIMARVGNELSMRLNQMSSASVWADPRAFLLRMSSDGRDVREPVAPAQCGTYVPFLCTECPLAANIIERFIDSVIFLGGYYTSVIFQMGFVWVGQAVDESRPGATYAIVGRNDTLPVRWPNPTFPTKDYLNSDRVVTDDFVDFRELLFGNGTTPPGDPLVTLPPRDGDSLGALFFEAAYLLFGGIIDTVVNFINGFVSAATGDTAGAAVTLVLFLFDWFYACDYRDEFDSTKQHQSLGESLQMLIQYFIVGSVLLAVAPFDTSLFLSLVSIGLLTGVLYFEMSVTYNYSFRCFPALPWMLGNDLMYLYTRFLFPKCDILFSGAILGEYNNVNCLDCLAVREFDTADFIEDANFADLRSNIIFVAQQWFPGLLEQLYAFPLAGSILKLFFQDPQFYFDNLDLANAEIYGRHYLYNALSVVPNVAFFQLIVQLAVVATPLVTVVASALYVGILVLFYLFLLFFTSALGLAYQVQAQYGEALDYGYHDYPLKPFRLPGGTAMNDFVDGFLYA